MIAFFSPLARHAFTVGWCLGCLAGAWVGNRSAWVSWRWAYVAWHEVQRHRRLRRLRSGR